MLFTALLAALAAVSTVHADPITSLSMRCTTSYGYQPLSSGTTVTTWVNRTTTTNYFEFTSTTRNVITLTPYAGTSTNVITTTAVVEVTSTSTPLPTTIAAPTDFLPLLTSSPQATGISRVKRHRLHSQDHDIALRIFRRQTADDHTNGFSVDRNGKTSNLTKKYPIRVDCRELYIVNETTTIVVTGLPETTFAAGPTALVVSTVTVSSTTTLTAVAPRRTRYAACLENNVVNHVPGMTGEDIVFNRIIYRPNEGFPVQNELIVNTTNAENCCIACQNTAFCAGSFFAPSDQECHLRLTQAPSLPQPAALSLPAPYTYGNESHGYGEYPTASGAVASSTSPATPISTAGPGTCSKGSLSLYMGAVLGEVDFPKEYALVFSNGKCGRFSVWPVAINSSSSIGVDQKKVKRLELN